MLLQVTESSNHVLLNHNYSVNMSLLLISGLLYIKQDIMCSCDILPQLGEGLESNILRAYNLKHATFQPIYHIIYSHGLQ